MLINIDIQRIPPETHLLVRERRLTASIAREFQGVVVDNVNRGNNRIVLNMSAVQFLDSSGLGALVGARKAVGDNGELKICCLQPQVINVLELTKLCGYFDIYDSMPPTTHE